MTAQKKILIVDDERNNIDLLSAILKDYDKQVAINGNQALKIAQSKQPPDLILLDVMMPEMDGHKVCQRLKENARTREIPVIFVTAKNSISDEMKGLEMGAVDYITKPLSPPVILARVKTHLALRSAFRRLKKQYTELKAMAELKQDMESITNHDLKSPINAIIGFSDLLLNKESFSKEDLKRFYKYINNSAMRLRDTVNHSLSLVKIERGIYQVELKNFKVLELLNCIINDARNLIDKKRLLITVLVDGRPVKKGEPFAIYGEEQLSYTLFSNLIKNALEASPEEHPVVVSLRASKETAMVAIHNHGAVPEEIRDRFFDKFVSSGKKTGTGLGTYSARLMAEVQKGSNHLQTSDEAGTTVTVALLRGIDYELERIAETATAENSDHR